MNHLHLGLHLRAGTRFLSLLVLAMTMVGCQSVSREYPRSEPGEVWSAMQSAALAPEYDDWHVMQNEVWVDEEQARIEVYRVLRRSLHRPGAQPHGEKRTMKLGYMLDETDPPTVVVTSRSWEIPERIMLEGERYFIAIDDLLYGSPVTGMESDGGGGAGAGAVNEAMPRGNEEMRRNRSTATNTDADRSAPEENDDDDDEVIDIDDLEP